MILLRAYLMMQRGEFVNKFISIDIVFSKLNSITSTVPNWLMKNEYGFTIIIKKVARGLKYNKVEQFWSFLIAEFWGVKGQDLTSIHFWFFQLLWSSWNIHLIGYCRGKLYDNHLLGENVHNMNRIKNPDALSSFLDYSRDFSFVKSIDYCIYILVRKSSQINLPLYTATEKMLQGPFE